MRPPLALVPVLLLAASSCGAPPSLVPEVRAASEPPPETAIAATLDDWHDAAAHADEERYFGHLAEDAVFLGTDAKERWDVAAFRAYAHPHFAKGKAWSFTATRRHVMLDPGGTMAWFDEELDAPNLGPARGSGVLVKRGAAWKIRQYNLAITVPNERFDEVKRAAAGIATPAVPCSAAAGVYGVVRLRGKPPRMGVPVKRRDAEFCKRKPVVHNAVIAAEGKLADVLVRIAVGEVKGTFVAPSRPAVVRAVDCTYEPRMLGVMAGQEVAFTNADETLHNIHTFRNAETWFNQAQPKGSGPIVKELDEPGILRLTSDIFPWMRGFVVVTDHPFFAVTRGDGAFRLDGVPPGHYTLEAWHSIYGRKTARVEIAEGARAEVNFEYTGAEAEPRDNLGELKGLF